MCALDCSGEFEWSCWRQCSILGAGKIRAMAPGNERLLRATGMNTRMIPWRQLNVGITALHDQTRNKFYAIHEA